MAKISEELRKALEADESCELDQVIKEGKSQDFEALQSLLSMDPSVDPQHRRKALYALGRWGDPAPVDAINKLLPELDEGERVTAVDALGRLGTEAALTGLLNCASDPSPDVRKFVARALGRIDLPEAQKKLKEIETDDSVDYVRDMASKHLKSDT